MYKSTSGNFYAIPPLVGDRLYVLVNPERMRMLPSPHCQVKKSVSSDRIGSTLQHSRHRYTIASAGFNSRFHLASSHLIEVQQGHIRFIPSHVTPVFDTRAVRLSRYSLAKMPSLHSLVTLAHPLYALCALLFRILGRLHSKVMFPELCRIAGFKNDRPCGGVVILSFMSLFAFLVTSVFAIKFPHPATKKAVTIVNSVLSVTILCSFLFDIALGAKGKNTGRHRPYRRNLANTVLTVFFTIVVLTALYSKRWYQALNRDAIQLSSHSVVSLVVTISRLVSSLRSTHPGSQP